MTTSTTPVRPAVPADAAGVLAFARERRAVADRAEFEVFCSAVQWAVLHPAESLAASEPFRLRSGGEHAIGLAGPGAPLVAEFAVAEFAAALGMGPEAGKYLVGHALEVRYRLPRLWARLECGDLPVWKARRVADATVGRGLSMEAAGFVDAHVAPIAHKVTATQLGRLVDEAVARHMPETAEAERRRAADGRHFTIDHQQVSFAGTSLVHGELDLADALDLDDAIRAIAGSYADLGSAEPLDVRRSQAVGELARRQLALDLGAGAGAEPEPSASSAPRKPVRKTVLYVHLTDAALIGGDGVGRCENTRSPITATQIRDWCGHPDTHLMVKPVIDLDDRVHVESYEVPDRIKEPVALRDGSCVFPWCTRPARRLDADHIRPYPAGATSTDNLASLCRFHHRLKTHGGWTYTDLGPGTYLWRSPHGYHYLRDHTGTQDVTTSSRPLPAGPEPPRD